MNWLTVISNIWKIAPYVVAGIEQIHSNETTETKTQLAQDALSIALQGSAQVLGPANEQTAQIVGGAVSSAIAVSQQMIQSLKTPAQVVAPNPVPAPVQVVAPNPVPVAAKSQLG